MNYLKEILSIFVPYFVYRPLGLSPHGLLDFLSISSSCLSFSFNLCPASVLLIRPGTDLIQIRLLSGHGHSHRLD